MKVLFIYSLDNGILPNGLLSSQELIQFGISYISSHLKKTGHSTSLAITSRSLGSRAFKEIRNCIDSFKPDVICFSAVATQYNFIAEIAAKIKHVYPRIYLVIGGVHVTLNPAVAVSADFDAICVGEGEEPALELVTQLQEGKTPSGIPNLWIKNNGALEKNITRKFIQDLDMLPFPDRKMWQSRMSEKASRMCSVLLSRGCPFDCSYCSNHALRKVAEGPYVRHRSPENIGAELQDIVTEFPSIEEIYFETETLVSNRDWCLALCSLLERFNATLKRPLTFGANIRIVPGFDLDDVFAALKRCNFRFVNIGLESGSERIRREVLRRRYSNSDVINTVALARKHGLKVAIYNLIGVPGETFDDFKETVKMNRICKPDWHLTSIYFPYPGTDLYDLCEAKGLLSSSVDGKRERQDAVLDLQGFSRKQIHESLRYFNYYVFKQIDPDNRLSASLLYLWNVRIKRFHKRFLKYLKAKLHSLFASRNR